jgi:hypothetical protein
MKLVILTAADVEQFKKALPTAKSTPPVLHHEELTADGVAIGLVRPAASEDERTNTYSIGFSRGDSDYVFIVRPTVHEVPSITLNIIRRAAAEPGAAEFASYTVLKDTVTTLKGQVAGLHKGQTGGATSETALGAFDLAALLKYLKVQ